MNTLGNKTKTIMTLAESYALAVGFTAKVDLVRGQQVKMTSTGEVDAIAAVTDMPFGVLEKGGKAGERVTVITDFKARVTAVADGDLGIGDTVSVSGFDSTDKVDTYKESVATNVVSGIALTDAVDTEEVVIGILRTPYIKA